MAHGIPTVWIYGAVGAKRYLLHIQIPLSDETNTNVRFVNMSTLFEWYNMANAPELDPKNIDALVMERLRAPFGCERILGEHRRNVFGDVPPEYHWRIHDANDDAIASVSGREEGYARLIVQALNEHFERNNKRHGETDE